MEMRTQKTEHLPHSSGLYGEDRHGRHVQDCLVTLTVSRLDFRFIRVQCELYIENALIGK